MINQPLFETYLIKPKNQNFVDGKVSLPVSLVVPEGILKTHELIIDASESLLTLSPFLLIVASTILGSIGVLIVIFGMLISVLFLVNYKHWLAQRILLKGGKIIEGWIYEVDFIIGSENVHTKISFELPTPDGNSIDGKLCYDFGKRTEPVPGNVLKFFYLNNQCYFFL
jgi:hypothetical protein